MGGKVTSKRDVAFEQLLFTFQRGTDSYPLKFVQHGAVPNKTSASNLAVPTQETTSYRSGSLGPHLNDEVIPTSQAAGRNQWYGENEEITRRERGDTGHPFDTMVQSFRTYGDFFLVKSAGTPSGWRYFRGPIAVESGGGYPTGTPGFNSDVLGADAISSTIPTLPVVNVLALLGEVQRDGLPGMLKTVKSFPRNAKEFHDYLVSWGENELNIEFAWKPLVSDLKKTVSALRNASKHLRQLQRDSGRRVRRARTFPVETSFQIVSSGGTGSVKLPTTASGSTDFFPFGRSGKFTETYRTTSQVWFSGAYRYLLPDPDQGVWAELERFERQANYLLGLRLTPELIWQLTPWSWLIDWILNIDNVLTNVSQFSNDNLVLEYGYLMQLTTATRTKLVQNVQTTSGPIDVLTELSTVWKQRVRATPFGFGLDPATFDSRKLGILSALGITQGSKTGW